MYTYTVETIEDLIAITSGLLRESIGFRAFFLRGSWVIELTGAH